MKISSQIKQRITLGILILAALALSTNWILRTPAGCQSKVFAVGASVCHQIPSHSFLNTDLQFPLCARCTGLYLGSAIGIAYFFTQGKKNLFPKKSILFLLLLLFLLWAGDGVNSFIIALLNKNLIYETTNFTRLVTGFGMGLAMATVLMTLFNMTTWKEGVAQPFLDHWQQIAGYALAASLTGYLLINSSAFFFKVFAYISIGAVLFIISMLYSIFWIILMRKENSFSSWRSLGVFLIAGFSTAMLQVTLLYWLRASLLQ
jgi:uncharacterized membrane protein